jgi:FMN-dependent dehydrogenase
MRRTAVDDGAASSRRDTAEPAPLSAPLRTARRLPRWSELRPLLRPRPLQLDPTQRRLSRALTIADLRTAAKRRTPRAVFDYTDGGAETETSLRRAREAFQRVEFRPRVLRDVTVVDTTTTLLGRPAALALALAPTGFTRMMHQGAPRRPSDDRVVSHQPYQGRHTGRTRGYGACSCTSSAFRVRHADAERVRRLAPPRILASVEENPNRCAGKRSHPKLWPFFRIRTRG